MATSQRPTLTADERSERGSRAVRRLRREGLVPGVVYGKGEGSTVLLPLPLDVIGSVVRGVRQNGTISSAHG